ncbi:hypothetical protein KEM64_09885 [Bacillus velezensis]|uniref:hypothetical protein n=1 Tax=Bacillus amyloliquefaciens group TaxID=1938374 RepID=UPI0015F10C60|nr:MULTISPECIES: hypothetical protein [Bacillus amyloliquefaciens group]MCP9020121.1 hypothetical protein [Bacillus velezensis]MDE5154238.1 hypothetical protein [Bacillus amyloliquefaciens]QTG83470.1 hypothetical protein J4048_10845 [Bacillus amyloliquefaciens]QUS15671.1 hypothetical protein KEM64_09885 [Bacillus velezensis]WFO93041.1 hypothetical protein JEQ23_10215 [Bacillus velezensis]
MSEKYRVYDERTNETVFQSGDNAECVGFILGHYDEAHEDYEHIFIDRVIEEKEDAE